MKCVDHNLHDNTTVALLFYFHSLPWQSKLYGNPDVSFQSGEVGCFGPTKAVINTRDKKKRIQNFKFKTRANIHTISPFKFLFSLPPTIYNYRLTTALKENTQHDLVRKTYSDENARGGQSS